MRSIPAKPDLAQEKRPNRWEAVRAVVAMIVGYLIVSNGFLFFAGVPQIAVLLGALSAMLVSESIAAIAIAAIVPALLETVKPPFLVQDRPLSGVQLATTIVLASLAAFAVRELRDRWRLHDRTILRTVSALLVAMLLVNLWIPLLVGGTDPLAAYGPLRASTLRAVPVHGQYQTDDELYRRFFYLLHEGKGHYEAFRDAWLGLRVHGELPATVSSYRLPTYYLLWRALPPDAFLVEVVFLVFASLGGIAAAVVAGELAGAAIAPLAAVSLLVYAMGIAISVYVTYIDFPAACLALAAVAAWIVARKRGDMRLVWTAAGLLTVASLTREILAYMLLLAAASAMLEPRGERRRAAFPWIVAVTVFAVGYTVHAWNVVTRIPVRAGHLDYHQGSAAFAASALTLFGDVFSGTGILLSLLFCGGALAAWYVGRRVSVSFAAFALAALVAPLTGMLWIGNPGITLGHGMVNYWGQLFVPLALSLWPTLLGTAGMATRVTAHSTNPRQVRDSHMEHDRKE